MASAVQVDAERGLAELRVVPAAEPGRELDHAGPVLGRRAPACTSALLHAHRRSRRLGARRPPRRVLRRSSLGHTCARATPNAGGSATTRSVTVSGWKRPSTENALTVTPARRRAPRPARRSSARARARGRTPSGERLRHPARARAPSAPGGRAPSPRRGSRTPRPPATASDRLEQTHGRCGTPASTKRSRWRSFDVAACAVAGSSGCGRPSRAAMRAAIATGKSMPGATMPSTRSAPASRSMAGSSSTETIARRSAKRNPVRAGRGRRR